MPMRTDERPTPSEIARPLIRHGTPLRGGIAVRPPGPAFTAGRFGRLFPELKGLDVPDDAILELGMAMVEASENQTGANQTGGNQTGENQTGDNPDIAAGFTYLGQFIDHDITLDTSGIAERIKDVDQVVNFRTPRLDLDCLYGMGPGASPQLYDRRRSDLALASPFLLMGRTGRAFIGPEVKPGLPFDLPRGAQGRAIIGDHRNDENLLVAQIQVAFLLFHNAVARAHPKWDFARVRQQVTWHYQWMVLHDFLGKLVDVNDIATSITRRQFFRFEEFSLYQEPYIPVEFSVAAYRLGHSMVRPRYSHNRVFPDQPLHDFFVFSGLSGNIVGELANDQGGMADPGAAPPIPGAPVLRALPSDWSIDWRRFFDFGSDPGQQDGRARNRSRLIDPYLIGALHDLPGGRKGPGVDLSGHPSLAVRNLARGVKMQLPSGQAVARRMGVAVLRPAEIGTSGADGKVAAKHGLLEETPLWYYILKEAQLRQKGTRLGPVGSRILAEVFVGLLAGDPESFLSYHPGWTMANPNWTPTLGANPGSFSMTDLLRLAYGSHGPEEDTALSPVDVAAFLVLSRAPGPAPAPAA